jgi:hypothetical protein
MLWQILADVRKNEFNLTGAEKPQVQGHCHHRGIFHSPKGGRAQPPTLPATQEPIHRNLLR